MPNLPMFESVVFCQSQKGKDAVFSLQISIADQYKGLAELRSTRPLDCEVPVKEEDGEKRRSFHFQIEAISCSGTYSER